MIAVEPNTSIPRLQVKHELDAEGKESGVEQEDIRPVEEEIKVPFDPRLIDVTTEVRSLDTLLKRLKANQIDLDPDFQRSRGIWTPSKKSLLIESLLLRIPLPTFYVAELGETEELGESSWAVVDGIQRLSTIAQFVDPETLGLEPLRLKGLEYLRKVAEGLSFTELSPSLQLRILESQFTIQVIRRSTPEPVKLNIFARINTGGVPLSAQELRHALIPGPARALLREMAQSAEFKRATAHSISPTRMVDREMALRYLAFRMIDPVQYRETDFDEFLREAMRSINEWSPEQQREAFQEFKRVMQAGAEIFGNDAFRKRYKANDPRRPVSKALFEAVSVGLAVTIDRFGSEGLAELTHQKRAVRKSFIKLMNEWSFDRSISQGTGDPVRVRHRFTKLRELFDGIVQESDND